MASRSRWLGAGVLASAMGGAALQRSHMRHVAADPESDFLEHPPEGTPLRARSADGTELHIEVFGPNDRPTIVLIHGWTEALHYWAYVIRELVPEFRVVAYDLRGHGHSARAVDNDYSLERFGDDVEAVLDAAVPAGDRPIVAGHSLGGMSIAAWDEHHDSSRVSAAALLFTGLGELVANQLLVAATRLTQGLTEPVARRVFLGARLRLPRYSTPLSSAFVRYIAFGPEASPALVAFYERMLVNCAPEVRAAVGLAMADMDLHHALARLTVPTLVMAGENDRLTPPSHARRIADELPQLHELIVLPDTGHMGPLERPAEVARALKKLSRAAHERPGPPVHVPAGGWGQVGPPTIS
jgi:pimeloyl-ACP methyl ester carboxylesterase